MESFVKGDIVVIPFPFSDLSKTKRRPALVLAITEHNDLILCQITSQYNFDNFSIQLEDEKIIGGKLAKKSYIRPNKLFTADHDLILYKVGSIGKSIHEKVVNQLIQIFS